MKNELLLEGFIMKKSLLKQLEKKNDIQQNYKYVLVGKERFCNGTICYLEFNADTIDGIGTTCILLSSKEAYDDLLVGHIYKTKEDKGKLFLTDIDDIF